MQRDLEKKLCGTPSTHRMMLFRVEEAARYEVMRLVRHRPQLHLKVISLRNEEVAWLDIQNFLEARVIHEY